MIIVDIIERLISILFHWSIPTDRSTNRPTWCSRTSSTCSGLCPMHTHTLLSSLVHSILFYSFNVLLFAWLSIRRVCRVAKYTHTHTHTTNWMIRVVGLETGFGLFIIRVYNFITYICNVNVEWCANESSHFYRPHVGSWSFPLCQSIEANCGQFNIPGLFIKWLTCFRLHPPPPPPPPTPSKHMCTTIDQCLF